MNMRNKNKLAAILVVLSMLLVLIVPMSAMATTKIITLTPKSLTATGGQAFTQKVAFVASGLGPYTYYLGTNYSKGTGLPTGMWFNNSSNAACSTANVIYGAPEETGVFTFEIDADNPGSVINQVYGCVYATLTVKAPVIKISEVNAATAPLSTAEFVYDNTTKSNTTLATTPQFTATEAGYTTAPPFVFSEIGALPAGLSFGSFPGASDSTYGAVYGQVYEAGSFPIWVIATDGKFSGSKAFTIIIKAPVMTITAKLPTAIVGSSTAYSCLISAKETGIGTADDSVSCSVYGLPSGLAFTSGGSSNGGTVAGTVYATAGIYTVRVRAIDNTTGFSYTKVCTLTVKAPTLTIALTSGSLTSSPGALDCVFAAKNSAITTGASFAYTEAGRLPFGVSWDASSATISGTLLAQSVGSYPIIICATDKTTGYSISKVFTITAKAK
jgi:hypothetical protein